MTSYEIFNMIIDEEAYGDETVTADFSHNNRKYSITFNKSDFELVNSWVFVDKTSLPANLSESMVDSIREEVKKKI